MNYLCKSTMVVACGCFDSGGWQPLLLFAVGLWWWCFGRSLVGLGRCGESTRKLWLIPLEVKTFFLFFSHLYMHIIPLPPLPSNQPTTSTDDTRSLPAMSLTTSPFYIAKICKPILWCRELNSYCGSLVPSIARLHQEKKKILLSKWV